MFLLLLLNISDKPDIINVLILKKAESFSIILLVSEKKLSINLMPDGANKTSEVLSSQLENKHHKLVA